MCLKDRDTKCKMGLIIFGVPVFLPKGEWDDGRFYSDNRVVQVGLVQALYLALPVPLSIQTHW